MREVAPSDFLVSCLVTADEVVFSWVLVDAAGLVRIEGEVREPTLVQALQALERVDWASERLRARVFVGKGAFV
jgi:hypothetical protein